MEELGVIPAAAGCGALLYDESRHHAALFLGVGWGSRGAAPDRLLRHVAENRQARFLSVSSWAGDVVWNRQAHTSRVREVARSDAGGAPDDSADGLYTTETGLALAIFTADCVPILIAGIGETAAVHAGWRGLADGILERALRKLETPARSLTAWIGPAMGGCCYQVADEVAQRVAQASGPDSVLDRDPRPHLDLAEGAREQLASRGLRDLRLFDRCTGCRPDQWWSHRRGARPGERNVAFIWRRTNRS